MGPAESLSRLQLFVAATTAETAGDIMGTCAVTKSGTSAPMAVITAVCSVRASVVDEASETPPTSAGMSTPTEKCTRAAQGTFSSFP
eukprot:m.367020 g.367020  ORF g.367020 m.367020 type:complete len:87 (-) comp16661_c1_seq8:1765-2025(-)